MPIMSKQFCIRCTPEQYALFEQAARLRQNQYDQPMEVATWVREAALERAKRETKRRNIKTNKEGA